MDLLSRIVSLPVESHREIWDDSQDSLDPTYDASVSDLAIPMLSFNMQCSKLHVHRTDGRGRSRTWVLTNLLAPTFKIEVWTGTDHVRQWTADIGTHMCDFWRPPINACDIVRQTDCSLSTDKS